MSEGKSSLDALRIDRKSPPSRSRLNLLLGAFAIAILFAAAGAAAYVYWPANAIPVHAVTAEAEGTALNGAGLDATGYVVARRMATLSSKIQGKMAELNVEEGQRVEKGAVVARLDDSNYAALLLQAVAQEGATKVALDDEEAIFARYQRLMNQGAISTDAFENQRATYDADRTAVDVAKAAVEFAQTNENDTIVRAPFSGMVTDKEAQVGEIVAPAAAGGGQTRTGIATLVDMDSLEVEVDVSENYIDRVHAGGQATVVLDAYPDWDIPASVIAVIPTADQTKGTVRVRIGMKAKDRRILPEMGARVSFLTQAQPENAPISRGVALPLDAVQINGKTGVVFVISQDDILERREVPLGIKTSKSVRILSGVSPGERVVTGDFSRLHDGVRATIQE